MSKTTKVLLASNTQKLMRTLGEFATEGDYEGAMEVIRDAMTASTRVRMQARGLTGNLQYEDIPDHRVRLAAAALFLECTVVKPVKMLEVAGAGGGDRPAQSEAQLFELMLKNWDLVKQIGDQHFVEMKKAEPVKP